MELPQASGCSQEESIPDMHVIVSFGKGISGDEQGRAMLAMEIFMRNRSVQAEVFKKTKADDSKLRSQMTPEQRSKL